MFVCCVLQPSLQARRDMAKGIADRIQKLADEIAGYQFPKQDTKPSEKPVDIPAAGAGKPVRRPSHIDVLREEVAYGGSSGAAVSSAVAAVKTSVSNSKPSPIHLSSAAQAPSQPAKASPVRPHRGHQSSRPPPLQPVEPAKDTFDPSLQDEIAHYMRTSPDAGTAPDPDNDVIIRARVRTNARRAASTNDLHSPAIVPAKHTQATKQSTVEAPKPAVIVDESPKPSPRKVLPPTAAAAAREKLAGKTAALRRRRVTDQVPYGTPRCQVLYCSPHSSRLVTSTRT